MYVLNELTIFSSWSLWELLMPNCSLVDTTGHAMKRVVVEVWRKTVWRFHQSLFFFFCLRSWYPSVNPTSLGWILLGWPPSEDRTFWAKRNNDWNEFPGQGKSETEAEENEKASYTNSILGSGMGPKVPISLVSLLLENGVGGC